MGGRHGDVVDPGMGFGDHLAYADTSVVGQAYAVDAHQGDGHAVVAKGDGPGPKGIVNRCSRTFCPKPSEPDEVEFTVSVAVLENVHFRVEFAVFVDVCPPVLLIKGRRDVADTYADLEVVHRVRWIRRRRDQIKRVIPVRTMHLIANIAAGEQSDAEENPSNARENLVT